MPSLGTKFTSKHLNSSQDASANCFGKIWQSVKFGSNLALETVAKFDSLSYLYPKFFLKFADIA